MSERENENLALPCIVCGRELRNVWGSIDGEEFNNQPSGGLAFSTHGHYGSTVFDPGHAYVRMEISVCDACIQESAEFVAFTKQPPPSAPRRVSPEDTHVELTGRRRPRRRRTPRKETYRPAEDVFAEFAEDPAYRRAQLKVAIEDALEAFTFAASAEFEVAKDKLRACVAKLQETR